MSAKPLRFGRFYNATATTAAMVASKSIVDRIESEVMGQIPESELPLTRLRSFSQKHRDGGRSMVFAPHSAIPSLGGLTVPGACAQRLRGYWEDWPRWVSVAESARFLPGYAFGVGLELVVQETNLTVDALVDCVNRFRERGEVEFEDEPLNSDLLAPAIDPLLRVHLWRWDASHARATGGSDPYPPSEEVLAVFNHESNAIRV